MEKYFFIYVCMINILTFLCFGIDKTLAKKRKNRIPEFDLLLLALVGGSIGALIGMAYFHHKTHKDKFRLFVPLFLVLHILGTAALIYLGLLHFHVHL